MEDWYPVVGCWKNGIRWFDIGLPRFGVYIVFRGVIVFVPGYSVGWMAFPPGAIGQSMIMRCNSCPRYNDTVRVRMDSVANWIPLNTLSSSSKVN